MPTLLLDLGNTALKWALHAAMEPSTEVAPAFAAQGTLALEPVADFPERLAVAAQRWRARPVAALGCSVAGASAMDAVERACGLRVHWQRPQARFDSGDGWSLANNYGDPQQLGADRWHALLAACALHRGRPLLVVTAGTATTVDTVAWSDAGHAIFVGGRIAPGVRLMVDSLARGTARLPLADGSYADLPRDTDSAIVTGVLDAQLGLVERALRASTATAGTAPWLLLGGGNAVRLAPMVPALAGVAGWSIEDNLVLRGLTLRMRARQ